LPASRIARRYRQGLTRRSTSSGVRKFWDTRIRRSRATEQWYRSWVDVMWVLVDGSSRPSEPRWSNQQDRSPPGRHVVAWGESANPRNEAPSHSQALQGDIRCPSKCRGQPMSPWRALSRGGRHSWGSQTHPRLPHAAPEGSDLANGTVGGSAGGARSDMPPPSRRRERLPENPVSENFRTPALVAFRVENTDRHGDPALHFGTRIGVASKRLRPFSAGKCKGAVLFCKNLCLPP